MGRKHNPRSGNKEPVSSWAQVNTRLEQIDEMIFRWREGSMIKHLDVNLFERLVRERFELDRQLMIAIDTIEVLSTKLKAHELILQHFTPEDLAELKRRIEKRVEREQEESRAEEGII